MPEDSLSAVVRDWLLTPVLRQIGDLVVDVEQVLEDVRALKADLGARFDTIDAVIDRLRAQVASGQVDQATIDELAGEVQSVRSQVASVDPEDPSGDDAPPAPTA